MYKGNSINVLSLINVPTNCSTLLTKYDERLLYVLSPDKMHWCYNSVACQYTMLCAADVDMPLVVCMPG
jgi:hypothetical protein